MGAVNFHTLSSHTPSPGQQVYRITGYHDTFRLAARRQNDIYFFEVGHNPHAILTSSEHYMASMCHSAAEFCGYSIGKPMSTVNSEREMCVITN